MKNYITQSIKIIALALIIGGGISAVSAWTAPTVNPPATGSVKAPINDTAKAVFAAVNTTDFPQIKQGGFIVSGVDKYLVAPMAFFKKVLLPGADTSVYVGGLGTANPSFSTTFPSDRTVPLTINMADRPTTGAVKYLADADSCTGPTKIITDSSAFQFWNESGNDNTDVLAKGIRLTGGNPSPGKILIAVDSDGKAVWATPRLAANGKDIIFDTNTSPVGSCDPVTPTDVCPNIDGNQPTVPTGMTVDGNGFCVIQQGQVDVCQNINGVQTTVPVGMVSDGAGNCAPPLTYSWSSGVWGACTPNMGSDWVDFRASPYGALNQRCNSWLASNSSQYSAGTQTRLVVCKDSNGNTVADSFCTGTKPATTQSCNVPLQYRVKVTTQGLTQIINYTDPGQCLYSKLQNPNSTNPLDNMFPLDCQVRTLNQSVPSGFSPSSNCSLLNFTGGVGYGFNAGNPGGFTASGDTTWQLQVKPQ